MSDDLLQEFINALQVLPGVGPRTAQRMALNVLGHNRSGGMHLQRALQQALEAIGECSVCRMYTEHHRCFVCGNPNRDGRVLCVVESPLDMLAIEKTGMFQGRYFVLHGRLSPLDGIGPAELGLNALVAAVGEHEPEEVVLATSFTVEGETTAQFLLETLEPTGVRVTRLAQGVPLGGELEFVDDSTLAHAMSERRALDG